MLIPLKIIHNTCITTDQTGKVGLVMVGGVIAHSAVTPEPDVKLSLLRLLYRCDNPSALKVDICHKIELTKHFRPQSPTRGPQKAQKAQEARSRNNITPNT